MNSSSGMFLDGEELSNTSSFSFDGDVSSIPEEIPDSQKVGLCCICNSECSKLHGCVSCDRFIHVFHSEACPIPGTEGYGKKVKCPYCAYGDPVLPSPPLPLSSSSSISTVKTVRKRGILEVSGATQEGRLFSLWVKLLHFPYMGTSTPIHTETFKLEGCTLREVKDKMFKAVVPFLKGWSLLSNTFPSSLIYIS